MYRPLRDVAFACVIALLGSGWSSYAQVSAARTAASTFRISGKVVDAHTGAALARCAVQISDVKIPGIERTVKSGEDGGFAFDRLPLGKYSLSAEGREYPLQTYEQHEQFSTAIAVGPGLSSENLIFKVVAESVLAGTVTDETGEAVRTATVRLFEDQDSDGRRATRALNTVTTDDRGMYEIPGMRPGAYFLVVTAEPWFVRGLRDGGAQLSSQTRALDVAYPTTFYPGVINEDAALPIPVRGGERLKADITLVAQPALRLHLNVSPSQPKNSYSVSLMSSLFGQMEYPPFQMSYGPSGAVELTGVLPGQYEVMISRADPTSPWNAESKHFKMDISAGTTELSAETGTAFVTVTGKVVPASGKLPKNSAMGLFTTHRQQQTAALVDEAGNFSLLVPAGTYEVMGGINGMYLASLKATGGTLVGQMLTVKEGDSPKLEVIADRGYGVIEGTALRGEKPMSSVMVLLAPDDAGNNLILFRRDQSDSDGTFRLPNIIPGRYHLLAVERGWELEWASPNTLQAFLKKSVPIEVRAEDHLKQSVQVQTR